VIHLFRPEVRAFYQLEKMWGAPEPTRTMPPPLFEAPARHAQA